MRGCLEIVAQVLLEGISPPLGEDVGVELFGEVVEAFAQRLPRHALRAEVKVEERAFFPVGRLDQAVGFLESLIQCRAGEGGENGDLHLVEFGFADKMVDVVEDLCGLSVETDDKTPINGDAVRLDGADGLLVFCKASKLPVGIYFETVEWCGRRTFEANQNLGATGLAHHLQELRIFGYGEVGFGKPFDAPVFEFGQKLFPVGFVDEAVVVGKLDERVRPDFANAVDLGEYFSNGFLFVA